MNNNGIVYIANEKDYIFQGNWNFPDHWEILLKHCSPRNFTRDSPIEIFRKTSNNKISQNIFYKLRYFESLQHKDWSKKVNELEHQIHRLSLEVDKSKQRSFFGKFIALIRKKINQSRNIN